MKQLFLSILALAVFSACGRSSLASWAVVPEETLIQDAELIVQGIIDRIESEFSLEGQGYEHVVIDVSEVLKGISGIEEVSFVQPIPSIFASSSDLRFEVGQEGAWLLSRSPLHMDEFFITHPSQYQPDGIVIEPLSVMPPTSNETALIPEPGALVLAALGLTLIALRRKRSD